MSADEYGKGPFGFAGLYERIEGCAVSILLAPNAPEKSETDRTVFVMEGTAKRGKSLNMSRLLFTGKCQFRVSLLIRRLANM